MLKGPPADGVLIFIFQLPSLLTESRIEVSFSEPICPSEKEIAENRRSRSAKLRVARRTEFPSHFGDQE